MIVEPAQRLQATEEYFFSRKLQQVAELRAQGHDVINLGIGSPDLAPSNSVIEAATLALQQPTNHGYAAYRSSPALRAALSAWYAKTYNVDLNPDSEILPLLGSKEGILYLSMAYLNPGDAVLVPNPGYPAYAAVAKLIGARVIYYDLTQESGWLPSLDALHAQDLSAVKLMWLNYPHMPSGTSASADLFKNLTAFAARKKFLLCNDNPYGLVLNQNPPQSLLSFDPTREVTLELNSLSKSFNMAGWRVGMIAGHRNAVDAVLKVKSNVDSGMFTPVQAGAIAALALPQSWHDERNAIYGERRKSAENIFRALKFSYQPHQVGLFLWARAPESIPDVNAWADELLQRAHVFLTPGAVFGSNGQRYARISLCAPVEVMQQALQRVENFVSSRRGET